MPTYDYRCERCGADLEAYQPISDDPYTKCRQIGCVAAGTPGTGKVVRVFAPVGVAFKGSGFYKTDSGSRSRASGRRNENRGGESTDAANAASGTGSSDADTSKSTTTDTTNPSGSGSANTKN